MIVSFKCEKCGNIISLEHTSNMFPEACPNCKFPIDKHYVITDFLDKFDNIQKYFPGISLVSAIDGSESQIYQQNLLLQDLQRILIDYSQSKNKDLIFSIIDSLFLAIHSDDTERITKIRNFLKPHFSTEE